MITLALICNSLAVFGAMLQLPIGPFFTAVMGYLDWFDVTIAPITGQLFSWLLG